MPPIAPLRTAPPSIAPLRILLALLVAAGPALAAPPPIATQPDPPARVGRLAACTSNDTANDAADR